MKILIIEVDGLPLVTFTLKQDVAGCVGRVAQSAKRLLTHGHVRMDAIACAPDILELFERGARCLAIIGEPNEARIRLDPVCLIEAHTTASLLASCTNLTLPERDDMLTVLGFLAGILPIWILAGELPNWEEIQPDGQILERGKSIYEDLRLRKPSELGLIPIKMCDALVLRHVLKLKIHPAIMRLWKDLNQVTATHRRALTHLMR